MKKFMNMEMNCLSTMFQKDVTQGNDMLANTL